MATSVPQPPRPSSYTPRVLPRTTHTPIPHPVYHCTSPFPFSSNSVTPNTVLFILHPPFLHRIPLPAHHHHLFLPSVHPSTAPPHPSSQAPLLLTPLSHFSSPIPPSLLTTPPLPPYPYLQFHTPPSQASPLPTPPSPSPLNLR